MIYYETRVRRRGRPRRRIVTRWLGQLKASLFRSLARTTRLPPLR
jgi:hypothetical protein